MFLGVMIPWVTVLTRYVAYKAQFRGIGGYLGPSLLLGYCLHRSQWGAHPISQAEWNKRACNNLSLLEAPDKWGGKVALYNGTRYRTYKTWLDWVTDYSDYLVFPGYFDAALTEPDPTEQARQFCRVAGVDYDILGSIVTIVNQEREQCLSIHGSNQTY